MSSLSNPPTALRAALRPAPEREGTARGRTVHPMIGMNYRIRTPTYWILLLVCGDLFVRGAVGIAVVAAVYFLGPESLPVWVSMLAGVLAFGAAAWLAAATFRRRSGGDLFKFRA